MTDEKKGGATPIYISYLTFITLLDWLRDEAKTIPSQFDRSFWGPKFSGSTGAQLIVGLRFLGLLEGDVPTERLERVAFASDEDRPALIVEMLRSAYGADFVDDLGKMTPNMVNEGLRALGTTDATHAKARSFFVNAAKAVNLSMLSMVAKAARNRPPVNRRPGAARRRGADAGRGAANVVITPPADTPTPPSPLPPAVRLVVHPALEPLLRDLPKVGETWDRATHDRWKVTWDSVLDYAHPVQERGEGK